MKIMALFVTAVFFVYSPISLAGNQGVYALVVDKDSSVKSAEACAQTTTIEFNQNGNVALRNCNSSKILAKFSLSTFLPGLLKKIETLPVEQLVVAKAPAPSKCQNTHVIEYSVFKADGTEQMIAKTEQCTQYEFQHPNADAQALMQMLRTNLYFSEAN